MDAKYFLSLGSEFANEEREAKFEMMWMWSFVPYRVHREREPNFWALPPQVSVEIVNINFHSTRKVGDGAHTKGMSA